MTKLLVSVQTADEAVHALTAGADLIDVKDTARGPLGQAHHETVTAVLAVVQQRVPVSAALGEWEPDSQADACWHFGLPLSYVKWGLAKSAANPDFTEQFLETRRKLPDGIELVLVAYADHEQAGCIPPAELVKLAKRYRFRAMLFDTFDKTAGALLTHLPIAELAEQIVSLHRSGVQVALGGSLTLEQVPKLLAIEPDWLAIRGAACVGGKRTGALDPVRLAKWRNAIPIT